MSDGTASDSPSRLSGSETYSAFIKEQLEEQEARKLSLEQRGHSVITTSGTLVTLLLALATVVLGKEAAWSTAAEAFLYAALACFVIAAGTAILTNAPMFYYTVRPEVLRNAVRDKWQDPFSVAEQRVAATRANLLQTAKRLNDYKAYALIGAMGFEVLAVIFIAVSVGIAI